MKPFVAEHAWLGPVVVLAFLEDGDAVVVRKDRRFEVVDIDNLTLSLLNKDMPLDFFEFDARVEVVA